jgi:hypothetical protein
MIARLIARLARLDVILRAINAVTDQIIDNLLLPPVALGFEISEAIADHDDGQQESA